MSNAARRVAVRRSSAANHAVGTRESAAHTEFYMKTTAALAVFAVCSVSVAAQTPPRSRYERFTEPIRIFESGLGTFTKPMSSTSKEAQAYFDQGFQMMYAFAKPEAVRSFRAAWQRDPECAICYWA